MKKSKHQLYGTWSAMKQRCSNESLPGYKNYGGRGIKVCDRWLSSFENFLEDMGNKPSSKHSLDRINNNGNYTPRNCRWATRAEQGKNKRNSITYKGESAVAASRRLGGCSTLVWERVCGGMPKSMAFSEPPGSVKVLMYKQSGGSYRNVSTPTYQLIPNGKLITVICKAANIHQDFLAEDVPALIKDLPNLVDKI